MARKGKQAVRSGGLPAWLLVLVGLVVGALVMWLVMRGGHMPISRPAAAPNPQASQASSNAGIAAKPEPAQSKYDFYSVLPEKEVVIPDAELDAKAKAERAKRQQAASAAGNATTASPSGGDAASAHSGQYLLLVGSFTTDGAAEARKAKLALKGFRADIQPATIDGRTLHRVLLGPYASASALEADKQTLAADGVTAIAIKSN